MKTTTIITAAVLSLLAGNLFAGNYDYSDMPNNDTRSSYYVSLAPTAPAEATFDDEATLTDFAGLAPVPPKEADFSDVASDASFTFRDLAPVAPAEAGFDEEVNDVMVILAKLAPVAPAEADFADAF